MTVVSPGTQDLMDSAHASAVLSRLNEQRSRGLFCDVTVVVEDVKFRAHRNILAACSGYFRDALAAPEAAGSSGQVLELMDLKSDVFASILNFMYCSKVTSPGAEAIRCLVAAGKRLGIPFLEGMAEQERQGPGITPLTPKYYKATECSKSPGPLKTKTEAPRPEKALDTTSGPRITNAFSITEVSAGNNPFTPLAPADGERQSPDAGQVPASCPATSCFAGASETTHALAEHSYAVNQTAELKDNSKVFKSSNTQLKLPVNLNTGPLKKRHRLRSIMGRTTLPTAAVLQTGSSATDYPIGDNVLPTTPGADMAPPPLFAEVGTEKGPDTGSPVTTNNSHIELEPPTLSPHAQESISVYGCEHCPEIFTNKSLVSIHAEVHRKRFVSHLYCKFCHRKFMHLKRLRNHEQVCPRAPGGVPPDPCPGEKQAQVDDCHSNSTSTAEDSVTQLPPGDFSSPHNPADLQMDQSELQPPTQDVAKAVSLGSGQRFYNCSVCKRVYVTLSSLKRHENVHSWQRAYPCHYCNKVFALAEYRTKHEIWHTGERRYQCIFCLETFMTYYILKNHQKSFHGIDPRLAVKKKSANGGLKASVYPIKLYRLLPMKFRKKRYKTYSQTFSEIEGEDQTSLEPTGNSLIPPFEENGLSSNPDTGSFPMPATFMATTMMVAPVMPRISFEQPCDQDVDQSMNNDLDMYSQRGKRKEAEHTKSFVSYDSTTPLKPGEEPLAVDYRKDMPSLIHSHTPEQISHNIQFLTKSLDTFNKLGELSEAAKRAEAMTKEILQSGTHVHEKKARGKTETYIAKPVCPGPSADGSALPLCQITVKIGNEAIIRRRIKGSKLLPRRKKKKGRQLSQMEGPGQCPSARETVESPKLRLSTDVTPGKETEAYDYHNDRDAADELWRPYYSYKAKKKRKKLRFKHRQGKQYIQPVKVVQTTVKSTGEVHPERRSSATEESSSVRNSEPRNSIRNRATYNCDICDSSFITESGLRAHIIGSHPCFCRTCAKQGPPGEAPAGGDYVCNGCMESGSCFDDTPRSPSTEKRYRCSFCPQRFLYLATKRSHEKRHQEASEKGHTYEDYLLCSKPSTHLDEEHQSIKSEADDDEESSGEKSNVFIDKVKAEDQEDSMSIAAQSHQDLPFSNVKMSYIDAFFPVSSTNLKHRTTQKRQNTQKAMHLTLKKQLQEQNRDKCRGLSMKPKTNSRDDSEMPAHLIWKNECEPKVEHISTSKSERWTCKQESLFEDH